MNRWWVIKIGWVKEHVDVLFTFLILFSAFLDISIINIGLNLRLSTVLILIYIVFRIKRIVSVLAFFANHYWALLFLGLYFLSFLFSFSGVESLFLATKQLALYCFLALNLIYFISLRQHHSSFSHHLVPLLLCASLVENIFALYQPISAFIAGNLSFLVRPMGFFPQPNMLGLAHSMMIGYILAIYLSQCNRRLMLVVTTIVLFTTFVLLVLTNNRATTIAFLFQILAVFVLYLQKVWKQKRIVIIGVTFFAMFVIVLIEMTKAIPALYGSGTLYEVTKSRYTDLFKGTKGKNESTSIRLESIKIALNKFKQSPMFGGGLANASMEYSSTTESLIKDRKIDLVRQSTEVMPIDIIGETGLFGVTATILFYTTILFVAYRNSLFFSNHPMTFVLSAGSFLSIFGMLINGLGSSPLTSHYFWWNIGLVYYLWKQRTETKKYILHENNINRSSSLIAEYR